MGQKIRIFSHKNSYLRIAERKLFLGCILIICFFFVSTYPHGGHVYISDVNSNNRINEKFHYIVSILENTSSRCNSEKYSWCEKAVKTSPIYYFAAMIPIFGIFYPIASVSLDTVYSKSLGNIDQVNFIIIHVLGEFYNIGDI